MSAGANDPLLRVNRDMARLAPNFAAAVQAALDECNKGMGGGLNAMVYEGFRSAQLQALYYQRGRTIVPPTRPVTWAQTNLQSWHGFGLAVDVVHATLFWKPPGGDAWFGKVAEIFKRHACNWGGDWVKRDLPHFQWDRCAPSPSDGVRALFASDGVEAVWNRLEAH